MNSLAKIKQSNFYDFSVNNLYTDENGLEPITDVEGSTALLLTDGTSWEFVNGQWTQIDIAVDMVITEGLYSFITSVCNSIKNDFTVLQESSIYQDASLAVVENSVVIGNLSTEPLVQAGDYVLVRKYVQKYASGDFVDWSGFWQAERSRYEDLYGIILPESPIIETNSYLTTVTAISDTSVTVDNKGANIRTKGADTAEIVGVFFVSMPPDAYNTILEMYGYDLFKRGDKEKRQERLGNYTYTNFEPVQYYGTGNYPSYLDEKIKYYQRLNF